MAAAAFGFQRPRAACIMRATSGRFVATSTLARRNTPMHLSGALASKDGIDMSAPLTAERQVVRRLITRDSVPLSELTWPITLMDSSFPFRAIV